VGAVACGLVIFAAGPQWWLGRFGGQELSWAAWQQVLGSSYVIFAVIVLLLAASGRLTRRSPAASTVPEP
jgi:alpha-1,2-mannosyltransferase